MSGHKKIFVLSSLLWIVGIMGSTPPSSSHLDQQLKKALKVLLTKNMRDNQAATWTVDEDRIGITDQVRVDRVFYELLLDGPSYQMAVGAQKHGLHSSVAEFNAHTKTITVFSQTKLECDNAANYENGRNISLVELRR